MTKKELEKLQNRLDELKCFKRDAEQDLFNYINDNYGRNYRTSNKYLELLSEYYTLNGACGILEALKLELQFNVRQ